MLRSSSNGIGNPLILGGPAGDSCDWRLQDLVLSWEAWRPPGDGFDPVAGLDPKKYALSLRAYDGACRYLNDAILDRSWRCYPLQFPDIPDIANELLYVSLLLGDAVARHNDWQHSGSTNRRGMRRAGGLRGPRCRGVGTSEGCDPRPGSSGRSIECISRRPYQLSADFRSCVTMALTSIGLALARAYNRAGRHGPPEFGSLRTRFQGSSRNSRTATGEPRCFVFPRLCHWLIPSSERDTRAGPSSCWDDVGLLERANGKIVMQPLREPHRESLRAD
jgi:hypothetical protein